jgi:hypothetical protein
LPITASGPIGDVSWCSSSLFCCGQASSFCCCRRVLVVAVVLNAIDIESLLPLVSCVFDVPSSTVLVFNVSDVPFVTVLFPAILASLLLQAFLLLLAYLLLLTCLLQKVSPPILASLLLLACPSDVHFVYCDAVFLTAVVSSLESLL